jgi:hypothetical protein
MGEEEWLTSEDSFALLSGVPSAMSTRKGLLVCVECCRKVGAYSSKWQKLMLDVIERFADGLEEIGEVSSASQNYDRNSQSCPVFRLAMMFDLLRDITNDTLIACVRSVAVVASDWESAAAFSEIERTTQRTQRERDQASLVRDIFGNPFRPVVVDPSWLTSDVVGLAHGIYEEKAFDRMPILADALQDAGCTNEDVLTHCRDAKQVHVRGCWVVDLLLGKK